MPHKDPEARKAYLRKKKQELLANPEAYEKYKEWHRNYYVNHKRQFLGYRKTYRKRTEKDPVRIAAQRRASRKFYYSWKSKTPEYNEHMREYTKRHRSQLRDRVLDAYGPVCVCCGERVRQFLTPDHINGGGCKHLKRRGTVGIYRDIIRAGFPRDEYQILCMNCNWAKSVYGECPHKWESR